MKKGKFKSSAGIIVKPTMGGGGGEGRSGAAVSRIITRPNMLVTNNSATPGLSSFQQANNNLFVGDEQRHRVRGMADVRINNNDNNVKNDDDDEEIILEDEDQEGMNDDDEGALILAAEAAAALLIDEEDGTTTNNNREEYSNANLAAIENVVASVRPNSAVFANSTNNNNYGCNHPLVGGGNSSSTVVRTFVSNIPTTSSSSLDQMSELHKSFIQQYYNVGGGDGVVIGGGRKDDDEEEEVFEDDEDNIPMIQRSKRHANNSHNAKEEIVADDDSSKLVDASTAHNIAAAPTTLRALCQKIPRSFGSKKAKEQQKQQQQLEMMTKKQEEHEMSNKKKEEEDDETTPQIPTLPPFQLLPPVANAAPQVTVDANGLIVIEQASLLPNPESRQTTAQIDAELGNTVIDEGETTDRLGAIESRYDSYTSVPRTTPARWSAKETRSFYNALRQCGTDFELMQMYCLGRTRVQLKRKYKIESRTNPRLVDMALDPKCKMRLDLSVFGDKLDLLPEERMDTLASSSDSLVTNDNTTTANNTATMTKSTTTRPPRTNVRRETRGVTPTDALPLLAKGEDDGETNNNNDDSTITNAAVMSGNGMPPRRSTRSSSSNKSGDSASDYRSQAIQSLRNFSDF
jgi:transcription factor TFIIIB component B''